MISRVSGAARYASVAQQSGVQAPAAAKAPKATGDFSASFTSAVDTVEATQATADSALQDLASGKSVDLHGTMIELEKADIALRTMVSVRDKVIAAYEQVMNMAI